MAVHVFPQQLLQLDLFKGFDANDLTRVARAMELQRHKRHTTLYYPGQQSEYLYFVVEGVIKICTYNEEHREVIKFVHRTGAHFGEMGLVGETERLNYAMLLSRDVQLLRIRLTDFKALMRAIPKLQGAVLQHIGQRLQRAERKLEDLVLKDARQRIVAYIKQNAERYGRDVGYERVFKHYLTQQDIANFTGTSRQTVTSVLNDLKKEALIHFDRRRFLVRDMERLA